MGFLRRIPLALLAAFTAFLLVALLYLVPDLGHTGNQLIYALDLVGVVLMPIGLFALANRTTVREVEIGATLAGAAAAGGVLLFVGSMLLRGGGALHWVMLACGTLEAIGFAVMIRRRYPVLAIAELTIVVGGALASHYLDLPMPVYTLRGVLAVGVELAIVGLVSTDAPRAHRDRGSLDRARQLAIVSGLLYAISLCVPAVRMQSLKLFGEPSLENTLGVTCLLYGWTLFPGWLANPLLLIGWILMAVHSPRGAFVIGCLAIVSALIAPIILFTSKVGAQTMLVGFYLWLASIAAFTVAAYLRMKTRALVEPTPA